MSRVKKPCTKRTTRTKTHTRTHKSCFALLDAYHLEVAAVPNPYFHGLGFSVSRNRAWAVLPASRDPSVWVALMIPRCWQVIELRDRVNQYQGTRPYGGFHKCGYPKLDGYGTTHMNWIESMGLVVWQSFTCWLRTIPMVLLALCTCLMDFVEILWNTAVALPVSPLTFLKTNMTVGCLKSQRFAFD